MSQPTAGTPWDDSAGSHDDSVKEVVDPGASTTTQSDNKDIELNEQATRATSHHAEAGQPEPPKRGRLQTMTSVLTWAPRRLRYDPGNPPAFGYGLNLLYAIVSLKPTREQ